MLIMKKNIDQELIFRVVETIRQYPQVFFLVDIVLGMPEDTKETLEATYTLLKTLDIDDIVISNATPYPGTALYEQCVRDNLFSEQTDRTQLWRASQFTHQNLGYFAIKPYTMILKELFEY
jgi:tRNA A37 methylthiotransferase MiaB